MSSHDIDKLLKVFIGLVTPPMMEISSVYVSVLLFSNTYILPESHNHHFNPCLVPHS